jgi:hypothetical protein
MVTRILLIGLIAAGMTSCATYRTGQTPDDVYYSPARVNETYVQVDRDEDDRVSYNDRLEYMEQSLQYLGLEHLE